MRNTGVEAQYLRVGDRIQLFDHEGNAKGYATVALVISDGPKHVVVYVGGKVRHGERTHYAAKGSQRFRRSEYVVVEWVPGIHERDLAKAAS